MSFRLLVGFCAGAVCLSFAGLSHAQCSKDIECKGDRVCEQGTCVSPPAPSVTAAPAPPATASEPAPARPSQPRVIAAPSSSTAVYEEESAPQDERRRKRNWKRHSTGMMVGGIVMVSVAPIALVVSLVTSLRQDSCERGGSYNLDYQYDSNCSRYDASIYGGLVLGVGLLGAGIPLIVVGSKREPLGTASLSPWATPHAGGLKLQIEL